MKTILEAWTDLDELIGEDTPWAEEPKTGQDIIDDILKMKELIKSTSSPKPVNVWYDKTNDQYIIYEGHIPDLTPRVPWQHIY